MNWKIISSNLQEAREQLEKIEQRIKKKDYSEAEFFLDLQHAYHHLNFAWNVRKVKTEEYTKMTEDDFNRWGQFPKAIETLKINKKRIIKQHRKIN